MIDLNDISGFISACDNVPYLVDLLNHVRGRLETIGVSGGDFMGLINPSPLDGRDLAKPEAPEPELTDFPEPVPPVSLVGAWETGVIDRQVSNSDVIPTAKAKDCPTYDKVPPALAVLLENAWLLRHGFKVKE